MGNAAAGLLAIRHGLRGPAFGVMSACASGTHAIGTAARKIDAGDAAGRAARPRHLRTSRARQRHTQAANRRLARVEQIKAFRVLDHEWLAGGNELTPTMKLKRKPIAQKYAEEIEGLYT
jgi:long-subunit acyl-CoA synthetase (AMP-forming)